MSKLTNLSQRIYVSILMDIISKSLISISKVDTETQEILSHFPEGFTLQMLVLPSGPSFCLQVQKDKTFTLVKNITRKPDLSVKFKHISMAFAVLTLQEKTTQAFANDRIIADGDTRWAVMYLRCLNRLEILILPKLIAELAVKGYPTDLRLTHKLSVASRIYGQIAKTYLLGS